MTLSEGLSFSASGAILQVLSQTSGTVALMSGKSLLGEPLWGRFSAAVLTGTANGFNM